VLVVLRAFALAVLFARLGADAAAAPPIPLAEIERAPLRLPVVLDDGLAVTLEALIVKPAAPGPFPLALLTHGSPRKESARRQMSAAQMSFQAAELARRGYLAAVVMRRGYGTSGGGWQESSGTCAAPDHERGARESARDLRAALLSLALRSDVDAGRIVVIGQSAGGIGAVALAADPPPGLRAVVNFAGGRGSRAPHEVCGEDRLVAAYAALGRTARVPSLWIYAENDRYFGPDLARRMFAAYRSQGGTGDLRLLDPFGDDGHGLFARRGGLDRWRPLLDAFLREHGLPTWDQPPAEPPVASLAPPPQLAPEHGEHWARYLESADNKVFAISPHGRFAWRSGHYTLEAARDAALEACGDASCRVFSENDAPVQSTLVSR